MGGQVHDEAEEDVALIHRVDEVRHEMHVLRRRRKGEVEAAVVRPVEPGRPIHGDLVKLKPRKEFPLLCDVETLLADPEGHAEVVSRHDGPERVTTDAYRRGWESVFGSAGPDEVN